MNKGKIFPVGLVSIASTIRKRFAQHQVEIVDINFESNLFLTILARKYDLIGISCMTIEYEKATVLAKQIKDHSNIPIILGGVHISTLPVSLRECFDIGVLGEGEETFCRIVDLYEKKHGFFPSDLKDIEGIVYRVEDRVYQNHPAELIEPLDSISELDYSLINQRYFRSQPLISWGECGRQASILTSRGCPYKCIFCSTTQFWHKIRYFSIERIITEIKNLVENYKVDRILIYDDLFTLNKNRLVNFARVFRKESLHKKVKFACLARTDLVDDEICEILKSINVKLVYFGFESGNEKILRYLKGGSVGVEQNKRAIDICIKHDLEVIGSLIFASPTETLEDMKDSIKFIDYSKKAGASRIWSCIMTPFPGTKIWEIAKERGKVKDEMNFNILSQQAVDNPLLLDDTIDKKVFKQLFFHAREHLHYYKWGRLLSMLKNSPFRTIKFILCEPWKYLKKGLIASEE